MEQRIFDCYGFSKYFSSYLSKNGIKIVFIANLLNISYEACRSKIRRDTFTYSEVCFLDFYFDDLRYLENMRAYLVLRYKHKDKICLFDR